MIEKREKIVVFRTTRLFRGGGEATWILRRYFPLHLPLGNCLSPGQITNETSVASVKPERCANI